MRGTWGAGDRGGRRPASWRAARRVLLALVVAGAVGAGVAAPAAAQPAQGEPDRDDGPGRAVVVSLPTLRWDDILEHEPPAILDVVRQSAIASMSVRTIGPTTTLGEAYATIGAGNRATAPFVEAGLAFQPDFRLEWGPAGEVYSQRTATPVAGAAVVHVGLPQVEGVASSMRYGAEPGSLGQAVRDAGMSAAVVGNADFPGEYHRELALALMDRHGRVQGGTVGATLTEQDGASPFGVRLDPGEMRGAVDSALREHDVVLVEASDLARLDTYTRWMTGEARRRARARAIEDADALVAQIAAALDPERDLLMLVSPIAPSDAGHEQLTMFALSGPEVEPGFARSGTTRRDGFVTLPDIAPTILDHLGVEQSDTITGALMGSDAAGRPSDDDIADLVGHNEMAVFRDRVFGPVTGIYISAQILVYALVAVAIVRFGRLRGLAMAGCLFVLAVPPMGFLWGVVRYDRLGDVGFTVALLASAAALAALAALLARRHLLAPPVALIAFGLAVLLGDVLNGGWLQIRSVFGYSPIVAGRFAGFGNLAYAMLAASAVVVATAIWALPRLRGPEGRVVGERDRGGWPLWLAALVLAGVLVVNGMPAWGSDVGGVVASVPAFAVVVLMLSGRRIGWRPAVGIAAGTIAVLGIFAALDMARPEEDRTHLSRFIERVVDGGGATVVVRKIEANVSILTSSMWSLLVPVGLAFLAFLTWRSRGLLQDLQRRIPGLRACLVGVLIVCVLGMAVNDSGVAVPAMASGVLLPYLAYLVVRVDGRLGRAGARAGREAGDVAGRDERETAVAAGDRGAADGGSGGGDGGARPPGPDAPDERPAVRPAMGGRSPGVG
ncbi:MAG TPA: hypothetical protein VFZ68_04715 [Acidimicrobiales bacterium]